MWHNVIVMPHLLICLICKSEFPTVRVSSKVPKYCSRACSDIARKKVLLADCPQCNKQFDSRLSGSSPRIFCGRDCYIASKTHKYVVKCGTCNKEFNTIKGKLKQGKGKFCSVDCFTSFKDKRVNRICARCNASYLTPVDRNLEYCSKKCACPGKGDGYVRIWSEADSRFILEHRYVMEQYLGRKLNRKETVHHKNGVKHDNRIQNLELWASVHHPGQRILDLLAYARDILKAYECEELKLSMLE